MLPTLGRATHADARGRWRAIGAIVPILGARNVRDAPVVAVPSLEPLQLERPESVLDVARDDEPVSVADVHAKDTAARTTAGVVLHPTVGVVKGDRVRVRRVADIEHVHACLIRRDEDIWPANFQVVLRLRRIGRPFGDRLQNRTLAIQRGLEIKDADGRVSERGHLGQAISPVRRDHERVPARLLARHGQDRREELRLFDVRHIEDEVASQVRRLRSATVKPVLTAFNMIGDVRVVKAPTGPAGLRQGHAPDQPSQRLTTQQPRHVVYVRALPVVGARLDGRKEVRSAVRVPVREDVVKATGGIRRTNCRNDLDARWIG